LTYPKLRRKSLKNFPREACKELKITYREEGERGAVCKKKKWTREKKRVDFKGEASNFKE